MHHVKKAVAQAQGTANRNASAQKFRSKHRPRSGNDAGSLFWSRPTRSQTLRNDSIAQRMSNLEWLRQLSESYGRTLHSPGTPLRHAPGFRHRGVEGQQSAARQPHQSSAASALDQAHGAALKAGAAHRPAGNTRLLFTPIPYAADAQGSLPARRNRIWGLSSSDGSNSDCAELASEANTQVRHLSATTSFCLANLSLWWHHCHNITYVRLAFAWLHGLGRWRLAEEVDGTGCSWVRLKMGWSLV